MWNLKILLIFNLHHESISAHQLVSRGHLLDPQERSHMRKRPGILREKITMVPEDRDIRLGIMQTSNERIAMNTRLFLCTTMAAACPLFSRTIDLRIHVLSIQPSRRCQVSNLLLRIPIRFRPTFAAAIVHVVKMTKPSSCTEAVEETAATSKHQRSTLRSQTRTP